MRCEFSANFRGFGGEKFFCAFFWLLNFCGFLWQKRAKFAKVGEFFTLATLAMTAWQDFESGCHREQK